MRWKLYRKLSKILEVWKQIVHSLKDGRKWNWRRVGEEKGFFGGGRKHAGISFNWPKIQYVAKIPWNTEYNSYKTFFCSFVFFLRLFWFECLIILSVDSKLSCLQLHLHKFLFIFSSPSCCFTVTSLRSWRRIFALYNRLVESCQF